MKIEWAFDARGRQPAKEQFDRFPASERGRVHAILDRFENDGAIANREKFKRLTDSDELWEFKRFQTRLLGAFRPGNAFVIAHALVKKADKLPKNAVAVAEDRLRLHDAYVKRHKEQAARRLAAGTVAAAPPAVAAVEQQPPAPQPTPPPAPAAAPVATAPALPTLPPPPDRIWTYMKSRDVLPEDSPLYLNMCRPYRPEREAPNMELMRMFIHTRLDAMPAEVRMVMNLDDPRLMMGAVLGVEFAAAIEESKPKPAAVVESAPPPVLAAVSAPPEESEPEDEDAPHEDEVRPETVWMNRGRLKSPGLAVVLSRLDGKATVRHYFYSTDTWGAPTMTPLDRIKGPAPLHGRVMNGKAYRTVRETLSKLDVSHTPIAGDVKAVWVRGGGPLRARKCLAVVLSNGGPDAYVTKFQVNSKRWTARQKVKCADIIGPANPAELVARYHGAHRVNVAQAVALFH